jgi:hypothetical protein
MIVLFSDCAATHSLYVEFYSYTVDGPTQCRACVQISGLKEAPHIQPRKFTTKDTSERQASTKIPWPLGPALNDSDGIVRRVVKRVYICFCIKQ